MNRKAYVLINKMKYYQTLSITPLHHWMTK